MGESQPEIKQIQSLPLKDKGAAFHFGGFYPYLTIYKKWAISYPISVSPIWIKNSQSKILHLNDWKHSNGIWFLDAAANEDLNPALISTS